MILAISDSRKFTCDRPTISLCGIQSVATGPPPQAAETGAPKQDVAANRLREVHRMHLQHLHVFPTLHTAKFGFKAPC